MSDRTEPRLREICRRRASLQETSPARVRRAALRRVRLPGDWNRRRDFRRSRAGRIRVAGGWSAVLLQRGTGAYVVVGVGAFIVGVAFTVACFRIQEQKLKKKGESKR